MKMIKSATHDVSDTNFGEEHAFTEYMIALSAIRNQYLQWQSHQDELRQYLKYHETVYSLMQSIDQKPPSVLSTFRINDFNLLSISDIQNLIDKSRRNREAHHEIAEIVKAARIKHKDSINTLEDEHSKNNSQIANYHTEIIALKKPDSIKQADISEASMVIIMTVATAGWVFSFLIFCIASIITSPWQIVLVLLFSGLIANYFNYSKSDNTKGPVEKQIDFFSGRISVISDQNTKIRQDIVSAKSDFDKYLREMNVKLQQLKTELINDLCSILENIHSAQYLYSEVAPSDFQRVSDSQRNILGQIVKYWEYSDSSNPRMLVRPWQDPSWQDFYQPVLSSSAPDCLRIGTHQLEQLDVANNRSAKSIDIPAIIPIRSIKNVEDQRYPGHIIIFSDISTRTLALQFLESLALRLLATFPVRSLKGSFIDPVALGDTFPFKGLPKSILSGQQIFTRNQDIREELKTLVTHVEQVIQNYLGRNYQTLEDYNSDSSAIAEAYRYLFIADFPTAFDSHTAEELKSLITNGSRAGVYSIIHVDTSKEALRGFDYNLFNQYCTVIRPTPEKHNNQPVFQLQMPNGWQRKLTLDRPPSQDIHQKIITALCNIEKTVKVETVPFSSLYPQNLWQATSEQELRAPIGTAGAREQIEFWLGENNEKLTVSSGLLAGKPGAGKSYTLHATILSLAMQYSPDELELYLLDFKEGVEFQVYVDPTRSGSTTTELDETHALPHAKVISIESDREFGLSVLQSVQRKIETRAQSFKEVGVSELKDYRAKTNKPEPRILVIIDEFQYMFQDNDAITRELNQIIEDITRRGRSFGVHLLLASQSLRIANIQSSIYTYMPLRMAMQMDQATAAIVLEEGNLNAIELLDRSGRIIYNTEFGRKRQNQLGQIADISLEERHKAMAHIHQQAESEFYQRSQPAIVFQGNRPSKVSQNGQLLALTRMHQWLPSAAINKQIIQNPDWLAPEIPSALWLGEAMRIGRHTSAILRRRTRSNLLLVGQSESNIFGMLGGALISLVHIHKPQSAEFHIIDLSQTDDNEALSEMTTHFQQAFQSLYPIQIGKRFPDPDRHIKRAEKILETIHEELQRRKELRSDQPDTMNFGPSVFFGNCSTPSE
jgi:DNA segregation ATPase FtsK/SpoIIIE, S-DNA-T family